jgi:hypothetical protein
MQEEQIDREIQNTLEEIQNLKDKLKSLYKLKKSHFEKIPADLILNFSKFMDARDILRFGSTQKHIHDIVKHDYLWAMLLKDRFNLKVEKGSAYETYKQLYRKSKHLYGVDLSIVWLDDNHWRKMGNSVELQFVWWFEVHGTFEGVKAGKYIPVLKGRFSKGSNMEHVTIKIQSFSELLTEFSFSELPDAPVHEIRLGEIRVGDERGYPVYQNLQLEMMDIESGTAKQGLRIDCIILEPLN